MVCFALVLLKNKRNPISDFKGSRGGTVDVQKEIRALLHSSYFKDSKQAFYVFIYL